jgi:alginate O-acetyltransferase complex protein AlgI
MLFNSNEFLFVFLPIVLAGFSVLKNTAGPLPAQIWLTLSSIVFYGISNPQFVPLLLASITINFLVGRVLGQRSARGSTSGPLLAFGVSVNLLALGYFKYANFIAENIASLTGVSLPRSGVGLPVGISFYTFTQIAFLIDAARGQAREYDLPHYGLFVTFFPHLIAGPIIHHKEMMPQFAPDELRKRKFDSMPLALTLFAIGLAKKVLLADSFALYASPIFEGALNGTEPDLIAAWSGALCYAFQLYFDFSGYSDMALGLALMFGIRLPVNFFSPYKAESIIDFWRRWHMTLSRFLRDYLYFPLGGNRKGRSRRYLNLLITMVLGGLWHGASWTFALWGALHGVYLMINHFWQHLAERKMAFHLSPWSARLVTFIGVVFAWILFRSENLTAAGAMYRGMLGMNGVAIAHDLVGLFAMNAPVRIFGLEISPLYFNQDTQWQAALMCILGFVIVWGFPNSMQIAGMEPWAEPAALARWRARLAFKRSARFALATGFALFLCVCGINAGAISEFIYFRF